MNLKDDANGASVQPDGSAAAARNIKTGFFGMTCTRCGMMFETETEAEDHLNGPACEPQRQNDKLTERRNHE